MQKESLLRKLWDTAYEHMTKRAMSGHSLWSYMNSSTQNGQYSNRIVNVENNLNLNTDWIAACFNVIAHNCAVAKPVIEKVTRDDVIPAPNTHPAYELFDRVNARDTYYDLMYLLQYSKELFGWMFWYVKLDERFKTPYEIVPIVPAMGRMEIVQDDFGKITKYTLWSGAGKQDFDPIEIYHAKTLDISDTLYGIGTLNKILRLANMDRAQKDHNLFVFNNQATPSGIISVPERMVKSVYDDYVGKIATKFSGKRNAGSVPVMDGGAKWEAMGMSPEQLQYVNTLELIRDQISNIIGVPRAVLGVTGATTRADAEIQKYFFLANTIEPRLIQNAYSLSQDFIQKYYPIPAAKVRLRFESVIPGDEMLDAQLFEIRQRTGLVTVNEELERQGKKPVDGGDNRYVSAGLVDIMQEDNLDFSDLTNPKENNSKE